MTVDDALAVLIVCGADFRAPSEKQALWLAEAMLGAGHRILISLGGDPATGAAEGADGIPGLEVRGHRLGIREVRAADRSAARAFAPDAVYALNARLPVIAAARSYARATGAPVFVHFEDDEWGLRRAPASLPPLRRAARAARRAAAPVRPAAWRYATRGSLAWVARSARGVDALTPALAREVGRRLGRPVEVILPASPRRAPDVAAIDLPAGVDGRELVVYTGALFDQHEADVRLGLRAVGRLRREGRDVVWVHAGGVAPRLDAAAIALEEGVDSDGLVLLGYRPYAEVLGLLRRADVLVQPGRPSEFNRLRLPSKLQAYLAAGRPTVTYASGLDELLAEPDEVLFTRSGEADELADRLRRALDDQDLRARQAEAGPRAAARLFDADANAARLVEHLRRGLGSG